MHTALRFSPLAFGLLLLVGCNDSDAVSPTSIADETRVPAAATGSGRLIQEIQIRDACDGPTFNAALQDPNACNRKNGLLFDRFIAILTENQSVGNWKFNPSNQEVKRGTTLVVVNRGGEVHSFTRVARFGGGVVPLLNDLSGTPVPAPECANMVPLPAGSESRTQVGAQGTKRYQCCIHPWMRSTISVKN